MTRNDTEELGPLGTSIVIAAILTTILSVGAWVVYALYLWMGPIGVTPILLFLTLTILLYYLDERTG